MSTDTATTSAPFAGPRHFDVLIVGAGISGIGAAHHLQETHPGKTYAILEARAAIGGTWDLFRYPGIRSDSDLHTFGYAFKPWTDRKAIAGGEAIRDYIRETAEERGIDRHIRFGTRVVSAAWSTADARWTIQVVHVATGERIELTAGWLFCATGYYRYDEGYTPEFAGRERFGGQIVHPQHWPEDLDYAGKRVVVIGSGATAVTLVPAMAGDAAHVTMLQRSPSYVMPVPSEDKLNQRLRGLLGEERAYDLTRRKNLLRMKAVYGLCQRYPRQMRALIRAVNRKQLEGSGIDVDTHFKPRYDPWDQRLCAVPDGDLFRALRRGSASVLTDRIASFTETGIELESGRHLEADIIVTATGLNIQLFGGIDASIDGAPIVASEHVVYKGCMLSGVPNFVLAVGYTNMSWTLKIDLVSAYFCRLLAHVERAGADAVMPELPAGEMATRPLLDFEAGYVQRALDQLPRQGEQAPWHLAMHYGKDTRHLRIDPVADPTLRLLGGDRAGAAPAERPIERAIAR